MAARRRVPLEHLPKSDVLANWRALHRRAGAGGGSAEAGLVSRRRLGGGSFGGTRFAALDGRRFVTCPKIRPRFPLHFLKRSPMTLLLIPLFKTSTLARLKMRSSPRGTQKRTIRSRITSGAPRPRLHLHPPSYFLSAAFAQLVRIYSLFSSLVYRSFSMKGLSPSPGWPLKMRGWRSPTRTSAPLLSEEQQ